MSIIKSGSLNDGLKKLHDILNDLEYFDLSSYYFYPEAKNSCLSGNFLKAVRDGEYIANPTHRIAQKNISYFYSFSTNCCEIKTPVDEIRIKFDCDVLPKTYNNYYIVLY